VIIADDGDPQASCHFAERFKDAANIGILVGIDFAEIARHWINDDQLYIIVLFDLGFELL